MRVRPVPYDIAGDVERFFRRVDDAVREVDAVSVEVQEYLQGVGGHMPYVRDGVDLDESLHMAVAK